MNWSTKARAPAGCDRLAGTWRPGRFALVQRLVDADATEWAETSRKRGDLRRDFVYS
jgi:hypothetical protein